MFPGPTASRSSSMSLRCLGFGCWQNGLAGRYRHPRSLRRTGRSQPSGQNQTDDTQSGCGFSLQRTPVLTSPREAGLERFYEGAESLFVRAYDAFYAGDTPPIAGDIAFYDRLAQATGGGPLLELGCGTGRIALALAQAGLSVTGVDVSAGMLALARRKSERLAAA